MKWQEDIVANREMLNQFEFLEDQTHAGESEGCGASRAQGVQLYAIYLDTSLFWLEDSGNEVEKGCLATATWPHDGNGLPRVACKFLYAHAVRTARIGELDFLDLEQGLHFDSGAGGGTGVL